MSEKMFSQAFNDMVSEFHETAQDALERLATGESTVADEQIVIVWNSLVERGVLPDDYWLPCEIMSLRGASKH